jgi:hypothetical protein
MFASRKVRVRAVFGRVALVLVLLLVAGPGARADRPGAESRALAARQQHEAAARARRIEAARLQRRQQEAADRARRVAAARARRQARIEAARLQREAAERARRAEAARLAHEAAERATRIRGARARRQERITRARVQHEQAERARRIQAARAAVGDADGRTDAVRAGLQRADLLDTGVGQAFLDLVRQHHTRLAWLEALEQRASHAGHESALLRIASLRSAELARFDELRQRALAALQGRAGVRG